MDVDDGESDVTVLSGSSLLQGEEETTIISLSTSMWIGVSNILNYAKIAIPVHASYIV
jgi:hypothetical protein